MATSSDVRYASAAPVQLPLSVRYILRIEGLAFAAISTILYARTGASWWLFAALWLVPDVSMLGYLAGPCRGARVYNTVHTYTLPITLGLSAWLLQAHVLVPFALIWVYHIAIDRLLGYGLKYSNGFALTHLGSKVTLAARMLDQKPPCS